MIRDPSDGSVKGISPNAKENKAIHAKKASEEITPAKPSSANNWGLKSLDREPRKPKPAPTKEELAAHYAKHNLGFTLKSAEIDGE